MHNGLADLCTQTKQLLACLPGGVGRVADRSQDGMAGLSDEHREALTELRRRVTAPQVACMWLFNGAHIAPGPEVMSHPAALRNTGRHSNP